MKTRVPTSRIVKMSQFSKRLAAVFGLIVCLAPAAFFAALLAIIAMRLINETLADAFLDSPAAVLSTGYVTLFCGWLVSRVWKRRRAIDQSIHDTKKSPSLTRELALPEAESTAPAADDHGARQAPTRPPLTAEQVTGQKPSAMTEVKNFKAPSQAKPDPYDPTRCDLCGEHKPTVRQRKLITIGAVSRTVRTKFCDECVAEISWQREPKPPPNKDFHLFFNAEDSSQVFVRPQNEAARNYLEQIASAYTGRWIGGLLAIKETFVLSLVRKLIEGRFRVTGDRQLVQTPRLFVHEGEFNIYTGGQPIPQKTVEEILKAAGKPH